MKWWRKIVFWLLETAVVNSYLLYKNTVTNHKSPIVFRCALVASLASRHLVSAPCRTRVGCPRKPLHPGDAAPERLNQQLHIIDQRSQRNCVVCNAARRQSRPIYYCTTCPDNPQLFLALSATTQCYTIDLCGVYVPVSLSSSTLS